MNEKPISDEVLKDLFNKVRASEGQNLRTNKMSDDAMIKYIERLIQDAVLKEEKGEV